MRQGLAERNRFGVNDLSTEQIRQTTAKHGLGAGAITGREKRVGIERAEKKVRSRSVTKKRARKG
jgi:hypothetical protein